MTPDGLTIQQSSNGPKETMERLAAGVVAHGMTISARVDHAAAARAVGMELRPTDVLIFGNPRAGTPLMQAAPTMAIALPLKVLVWQDESGKTWLAYDEPEWLAGVRGVDAAANRAVLGRMSETLAAIARAAIDQGTEDES